MSAVFKDGWFMEANEQWPGQAFALKVKQVHINKKTQYQELVVFESETWGNVMVLDGVIQITERDEMSYQEMLTHTPMFLHPDPKHVLVVGGGDGGIIREVAKHKGVESITMCEIDSEVIAASKKYFPKQSSTFDDPRLKVVERDALQFVKSKELENRFDVIIVDSSDPEGPAQDLFEPPFYSDIHSCLTAGGVVATQGECLWLDLELIQKLHRQCARPFAAASYASIQIPTYPCGQIGAFVCCKAHPDRPTPDPSVPARQVPGDMDLRYYTSALHSASFVLPAFFAKQLAPIKNGNGVSDHTAVQG